MFFGAWSRASRGEFVAVVVVNYNTAGFIPMSEDVLFDGENDTGPAESGVKSGEGNAEVKVEGRFKISPVSLTVFSREYEDGGKQVWANLQRVYTEDDGDSFDYTDSLRPRDWRKASKLLSKAADKVQGFTVDTGSDARGEM